MYVDREEFMKDLENAIREIRMISEQEMLRSKQRIEVLQDIMKKITKVEKKCNITYE